MCPIRVSIEFRRGPSIPAHSHVAAVQVTASALASWVFVHPRTIIGVLTNGSKWVKMGRDSPKCSLPPWSWTDR